MLKKMTSSEIPASLQNIDIKAILRKRGIYTQLKANKAMKQAALPLARKMLTKKKTEPQRYAHFDNQEAMDYALKQIHIIEVIEKRFENKVVQFVNKVVNGYIAHLEQEYARHKKLKKDFFDDSEGDFLTQAQFDFTPLLIDQAVLAGQEALKLIKSEDIYTPDNLRKHIAENVAKFTQSLLDTDRERLVNLLSNGIEQGQNINEIRNSITTAFENYSKNQAYTITRTEVARASTQGALDAWEQSGLVEGKQWVVMQGGDECDAYDGQVEALDGNFYADTTEFADGDPPLHPNCKCQLIPVLLDESKVYTPSPNKALLKKINELESQIDKRKKDFKDLKAKSIDDEAYIKALEKYLNAG